MAANAR
jgi:uncharacterized membrane protein YidH (DUF202 family)